MHIDPRILTEILAKHTLRYVKIIINHDPLECTSRMKGCFSNRKCINEIHSINRRNEENCMIILINVKRLSTKLQCLIF